MNVKETLYWYADNICGYCWEMIPCMLIGLFLFLIAYPFRKKRLQSLFLCSSVLRETTLLLFVMFSSGLAALTLFPANFWNTVMNWVSNPLFRVYDFDWTSFYPNWQEIIAETDYRNLMAPFQEILRGLYGGPWVFFMLLGNIGIFMPIGFFTALLWKNGRWWKAILIGFLSSFFVEFIQFFIGRSTDIDDIILNTTGALLGYWCYCILKLIFPIWVEKFQCSFRKG